MVIKRDCPALGGRLMGRPKVVPGPGDGSYTVSCDKCGTPCRVLPESLDGSGRPAAWYCRCSRHGDPGAALLLCDACHEAHACPEDA